MTTIDRVNDYALLNGISFYEALVRSQQIPFGAFFQKLCHLSV